MEQSIALTFGSQCARTRFSREKQVGIGTRVRMVFSEVTDGFALPHWTIDEDAEQPESPWRYPQE